MEDQLVITKSVSQIKKIINSQNINDNLGSNEKYLNFKEQNQTVTLFYGLEIISQLTQNLINL